MRGFIARIQDADCLMACHLRRRAMAVRRNITFCDSPTFLSDNHSGRYNGCTFDATVERLPDTLVQYIPGGLP